MANIPKDEAAKWTQAADESFGKAEAEIEQLLDDMAGRGFASPPGAALMGIVDLSMGAKAKAAEANGKIYEQQTDKDFKVEEFDLQLAVKYARLEMEFYRDRIMNLIAEEAAQNEATTTMQRGDIERLNAEVEKRAALIIRSKADLEHEVNVFKQQLIDAQYLSLGAEIELINAQVETAETRLQTVAQIYALVEAEQLVLVAERRKQQALQLVIAAQRNLAAVRQEMIPLYVAKADARIQDAAAIAQEAQDKIALENLGYDRIALKTAQESAESAIRQAETVYYTALSKLAQAEKTTELMRNQIRIALQLYANQIRTGVLATRLEAEEVAVDSRFDGMYARRAADINADIEVLRHQASLITQELAVHLQAIQSTALSNEATTKASGRRNERITSTMIQRREIFKG